MSAENAWRFEERTEEFAPARFRLGSSVHQGREGMALLVRGPTLRVEMYVWISTTSSSKRSKSFAGVALSWNPTDHFRA
jgi:hypothetical protein